MLQAAPESILVADESPLIRDALAALCEAKGSYRAVAVCSDGTEAFRLIQHYSPTCALLEADLPGLHTMELVRKVRLQEMSTRLIIMSRRNDRKTVLEALRGGAHGFILKQGPSEFLFDALRVTLEGGVYVSPQLGIEKMFVQPRNVAPDPIETLSSREHQVFTMLVEGLRAKEIAARLDLSPKTVDTYRASLMRKLDIHDVAGLVKFAIHRGLTGMESVELPVAMEM